MFRAKKIWEYREKIGGFYSINQLLEIKSFPDSLLDLVAEQVTIDASLIRKIRINHISSEEISKHPYCWYGVGKTIVNYRSKHGPFSKPEDLLKIYSIKPETYAKLVHYISLE
jgi:DNA uptake protein ComE-like DNA-binding protein